jgi:hypothetical protein
MATIQLDPAALRSRYEALMAEAEKIKRVLDLLPDLESLSSTVTDTSTTSREVVRAGSNGLRPVGEEMLNALKQFLTQFEGDRFLIPEVLEWLQLNKPGFQPERDRDSVTAGLRHFIGEDGPLMILVPGVGRRAQVYAFRDRIPEEIGGSLVAQ